MKRFYKQIISRCVVAGLLLSLLPLQVQASDKRMSRKKIDWYIGEIRKMSHLFENVDKAFNKGAQKTKKAVEELVAVATGKQKSISKDSQEVLGAAAVAGGVGTVAAGAVVGAGVGVGAAVRKNALSWLKQYNDLTTEMNGIVNDISKTNKEITEISRELKKFDVGKLASDGYQFLDDRRKAMQSDVQRLQNGLEFRKLQHDLLGGLEKAKSLPSFSIIALSVLGLPIFMLPFMLISLGVNAAFFSGIAGLVYGGALGINRVYVAILEKEEQEHPGTLTAQDKEAIRVFKNVAKGPIFRAVKQGVKIKNAREAIVKQFITQNKLDAPATKDIENYLLAKMRRPALEKLLYPMNLHITWYNYLKYMNIDVRKQAEQEYNQTKALGNQEKLNALMRQQIEQMKKMYNAMSWATKAAKRLTPGFIALNAKEFALKVKPVYAVNQNVFNSDEKVIKKVESRYGKKMDQLIQDPIQEYKDKVEEIMQSLSVQEQDMDAVISE